MWEAARCRLSRASSLLQAGHSLWEAARCRLSRASSLPQARLFPAASCEMHGLAPRPAGRVPRPRRGRGPAPTAVLAGSWLRGGSVRCGARWRRPRGGQRPGPITGPGARHAPTEWRVPCPRSRHRGPRWACCPWAGAGAGVAVLSSAPRRCRWPNLPAPAARWPARAARRS